MFRHTDRGLFEASVKRIGAGNIGQLDPNLRLEGRVVESQAVTGRTRETHHRDSDSPRYLFDDTGHILSAGRPPDRHCPLYMQEPHVLQGTQGPRGRSPRGSFCELVPEFQQMGKSENTPCFALPAGLETPYTNSLEGDSHRDALAPTSLGTWRCPRHSASDATADLGSSCG